MSRDSSIAKSRYAAGRSALLLVDNQRDFLQRSGVLDRLAEMPIAPSALTSYVDATNRATATARQAGLTVVHVATEFEADYSDCALSRSWAESAFNRHTGALVKGSWGAGIVDELVVDASDFQLKKKGHGAFQGTILDDLLRRIGVDHIYLGGGAVQGCLTDTALVADGLGYTQTLIPEIAYPDTRHEKHVLSEYADMVTVDEFIQHCAREPEATSQRQTAVALVLLDVRDGVLGAAGLAATEFRLATGERGEIIQSIEEVLSAARLGSRQVVFVSSATPEGTPQLAPPGGATEGMFTSLEKAKDFVEGIAPAPGERVVLKSGASALFQTALDRTLRDAGVEEVLFVGGDASNLSGLAASVRMASGLGYDVSVVDGTFYGDTGALDDLIARRGERVSRSEAMARLSSDKGRGRTIGKNATASIHRNL